MALQDRADRTSTDPLRGDEDGLTMAELIRLVEVTDQDHQVSRGICVLVQMAYKRGWAKGFLLGAALTTLTCGFLTYIL